jgi:hypothetical protein
MVDLNSLVPYRYLVHRVLDAKFVLWRQNAEREGSGRGGEVREWCCTLV